MANKNIQMKHKQNGQWDNLYPLTLTENVFDGQGNELNTTLTGLNSKDSTLESSINAEKTRVTNLTTQVSQNKTAQETAIQNVNSQIANMKPEKGSNEYGHWIKRADGTMTCWMTFEVKGPPTGTWGALYYWEPNPRDLWYPQPFIELPSIEYAHAGSHFFWAQTTSRERAMGIAGYRPTNVEFNPVTVTLKATGRWSEAVDGNFFRGRDYPTYWESHLTQKVNAVKTQEAKHSDTFTFAFITDMHMDLNNRHSFSLVHKLMESLDLRAIMVGGDVVENPAVTPKERVLRQIKEVVDGFGPHWERLMFVVGNHDDNTASRKWAETLQPEEQYNAMFKHMGGSSVLGPGKTYFYKDDPLNKVRYIGLDSADVPYIKVGEGLKYESMYTFAYRDEQIRWFRDEALNTPDDSWSVIVTSHTPPAKEGMTAWDFPTYNEELVRGILKAYKEKSTYSGTSRSDIPSDFRTSVTADFSNKGGDVIAWFCGHLHYDNVTQMPEEIPLISVLNDGSTRWLDSPARTSGTTNEQAFDLVTVNKNERKLYLTRVGAGKDRVVSY